jgi:hypothetical protein
MIPVNFIRAYKLTGEEDLTFRNTEKIIQYFILSSSTSFITMELLYNW